MKNRKKQRKVETEVADLRLKLATIQSRNIVLSNREIRLLRSVKRCHRYFAVIIALQYSHSLCIFMDIFVPRNFFDNFVII